MHCSRGEIEAREAHRALATQPGAGLPEALAFAVLLLGAGGDRGAENRPRLCGLRAPSTLAQHPAVWPAPPACAAVTKAALGQAAGATPGQFHGALPTSGGRSPFRDPLFCLGFGMKPTPPPVEGPGTPTPPAPSAGGRAELCQDEVFIVSFHLSSSWLQMELDMSAWLDQIFTPSTGGGGGQGRRSLCSHHTSSWEGAQASEKALRRVAFLEPGVGECP